MHLSGTQELQARFGASIHIVSCQQFDSCALGFPRGIPRGKSSMPGRPTLSLGCLCTRPLPSTTEHTARALWAHSAKLFASRPVWCDHDAGSEVMVVSLESRGARVVAPRRSLDPAGPGTEPPQKRTLHGPRYLLWTFSFPKVLSVDGRTVSSLRPKVANSVKMCIKSTHFGVVTYSTFWDFVSLASKDTSGLYP